MVHSYAKNLTRIFAFFQYLNRNTSRRLRGELRADEGGTKMVTITEAAAAKIQELMPEDNAAYALRMRVVGGGCSGLQYQMEIDQEPGTNDKVFTSNGIKVFVDMKSALYLAGAKVDYLNSLMESGFKITNPNAATTCGCGQSFR
jgi:iron-sulfur cluster assembly protein